MTDSRIDTFFHIRTVQTWMREAIKSLLQRSLVHDDSKLESPEVEVFDEFTPKLADSTYGSEEYAGFLAAMKPALDHHYAVNSHHPEHYSQWECLQCGRVYLAHDVPPIAYPETTYRWCIDCFNGEYPGFFELCLLEKPGIRGMSLLDLIEMLCDWKAATTRHKDGDLARSIEINQERFGYSDELKSILRNTAIELGMF